MTLALHALPRTETPPQGVSRLDEWGVIRATGPDAAAFLHGQLTNDIEHLETGVARLAGYCSAKGRLLASFVVWRPAPDEVLLACSADLLPATLKRLSMFVLRAKCRLSDASGDFALYGLAGAPAAATGLRPGESRSDAGRHTIRLADVDGVARAMLAQPAGDAPPAYPPLEAGSWQWLEAASGVPRIVAATSEQFVPQMVNLELVGGVNFQKGCYPGQEVVARSQYRGTLKRRAFLFTLPVPARPGQELFDAADPGQPAGMVVNAASWRGSTLVLAEVKLAAVGQEPLRLGSADGPALDPVALPYEVPMEANA
ncbi:MAG: folate-binding protein [Aquincola sp.]|nr:folate-binding protein [Aquincola sp.]MDH4288188.1 folate-binding protein [Aquincola sp.]MDH5331165.1 folate-binding protein [Aquincola sp.]